MSGRAAVKQPELMDAPEPAESQTLPARRDDSTDLVLMFERLAKDPAVDVEKLEKLIELQERIMRHNARSAFNAAFAKMKPELPAITEHGKIIVKTVLRSTYARLEDIQEAVDPVLARWGFAMRHRTEWPTDKPGIIRIVGILTHERGHAEESTFEAPMDRSEYRTDIQSQGSTVSYGRRYTTLDLLNIVTRGVDNDGAGAPKAEIKAPDGFVKWWDDMQSVADEGLAALSAAWTASTVEYRTHLNNTNRPAWDALKVKAAKVKVASA